MLLSAGIIPVDSSNVDCPRFLLLRVYRYWDFPKGEVERGEKPRAAAVRECAEETGILKPQFDWGDDYFETEPYSKNKVARYYIARVLDPTVSLLRNPHTGIVEHHEYRWCEYEEARKLLGDRVVQALEWGYQRISKNRTTEFT
jgi:bis(5'-nucleosidyl)-tetraphosphatase